MKGNEQGFDLMKVATTNEVGSVACTVSDRYRRILQIPADTVALSLSAVSAYLIAWAAYALLGSSYVDPATVTGNRWLPFAAVASLLVLYLNAGSRPTERIPFWEEARLVASACFLSMLGEGFLIFADKADVSRALTVLTWMLAPFFLMLSRKALKSGKRWHSKTLIVGSSERAKVARYLVNSDTHLGYRVVDEMNVTDPLEILTKAAATGIRTIAVALSGNDARETELAELARANGFNVVVIPPAMGATVSGMKVRYVLGSDAPMLVDTQDGTRTLSQAAKRAFDVVIACSAVVALLVRIDGGPSFFAHRRVGRNGVEFPCLKFRSMVVDPDVALEEYLKNNPSARSEWTANMKLKDDPRVTKLGSFIRKTAIDELPQLINVLRGDMSLVGPRPITRREVEAYGDAAALYETVRPGVTGLWQVSGRSDLSFRERIALDSWYVRNWSPWHDIAILAKTVPAVLSRRGAY
jgi:Undecaprenyl-phosphate galactose phosphotransferase WbaP